MGSSVSVIIPTYNRASLISRAIHSALSQCLADDEIIVVDDGSTDNTREVVAAFADAVRYYYTPNGGVGRARNIGLDLSTKDLVAFLDSDDEWFPDKLRLQRALMEVRPDVLFCFSNFAVTRRNGEEVRRFLVNWLSEPRSWEDAIGPSRRISSLRRLPVGMRDFNVHIGDMSAAEFVDNYVLTSSLVAWRSEAGDALRHAEDLPIYEDWFSFAQLALRGKAAYLDCETTWQHGNADGRISEAGSLMRAEAWLKMNERIWSNETGFRLHQGDLYERIVSKNRLQLVRALIGAGRTAEARATLSGLRDAPASYRLLVHTPGTLIRMAKATRRLLMSAWRCSPVSSTPAAPWAPSSSAACSPNPKASTRYATSP